MNNRATGPGVRSTNAKEILNVNVQIIQFKLS